ncbi:MAG: GGDEF domain-containing protein [Hyphomicrobiaceae bacterium]|nr:GGDEF domain-containing protein [Hyphomicrobiaceae bacterium]
MQIDNISLLLATCAAAVAAGGTFFVSSLSNRRGGFLTTYGAAMLAIAGAVALFVAYDATFERLYAMGAVALLLLGMTAARIGALQFRTRQFDFWRFVLTSAVAIGVSLLPHLWGYDGLSFVFVNTASAVLLFQAAIDFWQARSENPAMISGLSALYVIMGLSYLGCVGGLLDSNPLILTAPPDGIFESINIVVGIAVLTGVLALSIALNHQRLVRQHREASETDQLTGAGNRRALYERFGDHGLPPECAVAVFDLDHFKRINDTNGHDAGDEVIRHFAEIVKGRLRQKDGVFRLGGEEFVVILPGTPSSLALSIAETIRLDFSRRPILHVGHMIRATASCGVWSNESDTVQPLDLALRAADRALYEAKNAGRDRSFVAPPAANAA